MTTLSRLIAASNDSFINRVVIALCGGNIDTTILGRCLDRGMAADGRLVKFSCTISDRPGGMAELTNLLFRVGVTIKDIQQERAWIKNDIFSVEDIVVVETIDADHAARMINELKKHFDNLSVTGLQLDGKSFSFRFEFPPFLN